MNSDEIKGKANVVKGRMKEAAADVSNNPRLHDEGAADEAAGQAQDAFGRARRKVGEAVQDVGKAIKR